MVKKKKKRKSTINKRKNKGNDIKEFMIVGAITVVVIFSLIMLIKATTTKDDVKEESTTSAEKSEVIYKEYAADSVNKEITVEDGLLKITLINNSLNTILVDKLEIKENDEILYETSELILIATDNNTYVTVPYNSDGDGTGVSVLLYYEQDRKNSNYEGEEITNRIVCQKESTKTAKYTIENYYEYYYEDGIVTNGSIIEKYIFNDSKEYDNFSINNLSDSNIKSFEENPIEKTKIYYSDYMFKTPNDDNSLENYKNVVLENGYKCEA